MKGDCSSANNCCFILWILKTINPKFIFSPQFLLSSIWTFLQSIHINIGLNLAGPLLLPIGRGFAPAHCYCESFGDWGWRGPRGVEGVVKGVGGCCA